MDKHLDAWKFDLDRIWSALTPDYREAVRVAAAIAAEESADAMLRQAAMQALPILRSAADGNADRTTTNAAHRRLGIVRDVLHNLTTPKFGQRQAPLKAPAPAERYRQLLGLPLDRRLTSAEIHRAYKRVAKTAHPDACGSAPKFLELSAAREALMKER